MSPSNAEGNEVQKCCMVYKGVLKTYMIWIGYDKFVYDRRLFYLINFDKFWVKSGDSSVYFFKIIKFYVCVKLFLLKQSDNTVFWDPCDFVNFLNSFNKIIE
jgi:hypothetical protein